MSDFDPIDERRKQSSAEHSGQASSFRSGRGSSQAAPLSAPAQPGVVGFDRRELTTILNLYGRKVAEGEWRDYAIDFTPAKAVFSIFRRSTEAALYRIEKDPRLARKQGAYSVVTATGLILKRGQELETVISVLDKKLKLVVG